MSNSISASSISPKALGWIKNSRTAKVLHVFDSACNLINSEGEIVSITSIKLGKGPFSISIPLDNFQDYIDKFSKITSAQDHLSVGELNIDISHSPLWDPNPDWGKIVGRLEENIEDIFSFLKKYAPMESMVNLLIARENGNRQTKWIQERASAGSNELQDGIKLIEKKLINSGTSKLAGLGIGLTPSGDDYLVGIIFGLWATLPRPEAIHISNLISHTAAPLTTTLSKQYIKSAAVGEAGELWHNFIEAVSNKSPDDIFNSIKRILNTGHTSGADCLAGFTQTINQIEYLK